jgi:hypothetical protein
MIQVSARRFWQARRLYAIVVLVVLYGVAGCKSGNQSPTATNVPQTPAAPPAPARVVVPITFVSPKSDSDAADSLATLRKADKSFMDYKLSRTRTQIQLQDVSVAVVNQMSAFTDAETSISPGRIVYGAGNSRNLTQDERDKATESVRKSTSVYLNNRFRVTDGARFEVIVVLYTDPFVHTYANVSLGNPYGGVSYGVEDFTIFFVDTQTKSVIWSSAMMAHGKTLDDVADVVANGVPRQLDILFGITKK